MSVAGIAAASVAASAADLTVVETNVEVKTPDGSSDAVFIHPPTGTHPAVCVAGCVGPAPCHARYRQAHRCRGILGAGAKPFLSVGEGPGVRPVFQFSESRRQGEAGANDRVVERAGRGGEGRDCLHRVSGRATAANKARKSGLRGIAWEGRWWSRPPPHCPTVLERVRRSTGVAWSPTSLTAHICSRPGSRRGCISESPRMMTSASQMPRTSSTGFCLSQRPRGDRSLSGGHARLVRSGHAAPEWQSHLQQARCRRAWSKLVALYKAALA